MLDSSGGGGSGVTLTDNNKLLGVGDKQVGTTDATNLEFLTDNKVRAILDSSGNFDVRDLRSSEVDILPNEKFQVVSGTVSLSNYEATIQTSAESDEFKTAQEFTPDQTATIAPHEVIIKVDSLTSSNFQAGVIDSIGTITLIPTGPFALSAVDLITLTLIDLGGTERVNLKINDVLQGSEAVADPSIEHNFYLTGLLGTFTILESKYNDVLQKGSINLADGNNYGLSIREDSKDYINIDTANDAMTLQNVTDINGSIVFPVGTNEIVITKELVGSQESMIPNDSIVQQSNFSTLSGELLTITSDETNITIPIMPSFTLGDKFSLTLNIDKQSPSTGYYIGIGGYSIIPINYVTIPQSVYPTVYYSTPTGFGGSFTPPGVWNVNPNFSAPNYNAVGIYQIKLVLEESGKFNLYVDGIIKFTMTLVGSNTFEAFIWTPTEGTCLFDTGYSSMLSDGGIVIDGYPVAQTFNQLLGGDPEGVNTFKQINTQGLIIGDEENIPDPTTDNSLRFGSGAGIINAETLSLESEFKTSFINTGLGAEVARLDHSNANL
ncbi:hypothetical protein OAE88_00780, partial [bacterium]|nr:hypothetical protein [bacterium]